MPWRPILLVGLGLVVFYMVDTATQTWGPIYLDDEFSTPSSLVALATFPYLLASLVVRLAGDRLVMRYGAVLVLRTGAVVASLALLVVVLAPTWQVAVLGFTLLGAGVSVVAPLSFSAAARIAGGQGADRAGSTPWSAGSTSSTTWARCSARCSPAWSAPSSLRSASRCRWCWCWR